MPNAQTLLYDRYSVLHIERSNNFNKVLFVLDTYQSPPRNCAIKVFQPIAEKFQIVKWIDEEFAEEAKRLKQLSLGNSQLPQIYTYSHEARDYYLVRELIEGRNLVEKVKTQGRFSPKEVKRILIELLQVLEYIHSQGVIHQNIKPKNIIVRNEDDLPMLINFGTIKHIVATYGFYGDKQVFSANNIYGYAPAELALGRPIPASDLYSLGLVAIYLLTGRHPVDLDPHSDLNSFKVPPIIASLDLNLARVIARAIRPNISDRYASAAQMRQDLSNSSSGSDKKPVINRQKFTTANPSKRFTFSYSSSLNEQDILPEETNLNHSNGVMSVAVRPQIEPNRSTDWWKIILFSLGAMYVAVNALIFAYDWYVKQNAIAPELSELSNSLSAMETNPETAAAPPQEPLAVPESVLNSQSQDSLAIPILPTGTSKQELKTVLGEPNAIQPGYWANSNAWIYKNRAGGSIDMGYLFDLDTDKLRQTEVAISPSVGLATIEDILSSLLENELDPAVSTALADIYQRQVNEYTFKLEDLEGSIIREADDHIYLGVWEADFH